MVVLRVLSPHISALHYRKIQPANSRRQVCVAGCQISPLYLYRLIFKVARMGLVANLMSNALCPTRVILKYMCYLERILVVSLYMSMKAIYFAFSYSKSVEDRVVMLLIASWSCWPTCFVHFSCCVAKFDLHIDTLICFVVLLILWSYLY